MLKNIKKYIQDCDVCQRVKAPRHRSYDETISLLISARFWEKISMNFIIELPFNCYENDIYNAILVVVDRYSKMTLYIFAKSTWSTEDLADVLFDKMFLIFFEIRKVIFDRSSLFVNDYWSALCYRIRVKRKLSIVFHSQIDEQTKRQNQTLKHYLRCYCNYKQDNWDSLLPLTQYVYNSVAYASTKLFLFKIVFDYQTNFQFDWDERKCSDVSAVRDRIQLLWNERDRLIKRLRSAQQAQVRTHNNKISFKHFKVEDKVMLFTKNFKNAKSKKKLFYKFTEFFEIENVVGSQAYRFCLLDQWRIHFVFHVSFFKSYYTNANIVFFAEMILVGEDEEYEVKDILKDKKKWRKFYYFVRWKEFLFCENNWVLKHYLTNAQNMLKRYHKRKSFITVMFKAKKSRLQIQKENLSKEE